MMQNNVCLLHGIPDLIDLSLVTHDAPHFLLKIIEYPTSFGTQQQQQEAIDYIILYYSRYSNFNILQS